MKIFGWGKWAAVIGRIPGIIDICQFLAIDCLISKESGRKKRPQAEAQCVECVFPAD